MADAIGIAVVTGISDFEGTYGTPATITRRLAIRSGDVARTANFGESQGIDGDLAGAFVRRGARSVELTSKALGPTVHELNKNGLGKIINAMVGGTSTIAQQSTTTAWLQTHTIGAMTGKSLTIQRSFRDGAGTEVEAVTDDGCKAASWDLAVSPDDFPLLTVNWDSHRQQTSVSSTTLLGLSAPTGGNFSFKDVTVSLAGSPASKIYNATVSLNNSLGVDDYPLGSSGLQAEPDVVDFRPITGSLQARFNDPAQIYDRFVNNTALSFELKFTGDIIESTFAEEIIITIPEIRFRGSSPALDGPGYVLIDAPFEGKYDGTNAPMTITYQSTDTTI